MIYVLVFLQFVSTGEVKHYQIGSFVNLTDCQGELEKAKKALINNNSQTVVCLEVNPK